MKDKLELTVVIDLQSVTPYGLTFDEDTDMYALIRATVETVMTEQLRTGVSTVVQEKVQKVFSSYKLTEVIDKEVRSKVQQYVDSYSKDGVLVERTEKKWDEYEDKVLHTLANNIYKEVRDSIVDKLATSLLQKAIDKV